MKKHIIDLGLTEEEGIVFEWQFGMMGDFELSLMTAIGRADESNLSRLSLGFPEHVEAFKSWARGNLHDILKAKMDAAPDKFGGRVL